MRSLALTTLVLALSVATMGAQESSPADARTWRGVTAQNRVQIEGRRLPPPKIDFPCRVDSVRQSLRFVSPGSAIVDARTWQLDRGRVNPESLATAGRWLLQDPPRAGDTATVHLVGVDCYGGRVDNFVFRIDSTYWMLSAKQIETANTDTLRFPDPGQIEVAPGRWEPLAYLASDCSAGCRVWLGSARRVRDSVSRAYRRARAAEDSAARRALARRRRALLAKGWTPKIVDMVMRNEVAVGMTAAQVLESIGEPERRNRTGTATGVREQWVYGNGLYVYVQGGRVTAWQDSQ